MVSADRQQVIETNRSLRNIKNELEALLEKGVITEDAFDSIHRLLPTEGSLSGAVAHRTPAPATATTTAAAPAPPSYAQSTGGTAAPPLPGRNQTPAAPPSKPVVAHCRALYRYEAQDARDVSFDKGDSISVYEKMNADWWMGANVRTGQEGIFPKAYVEVDESASAGAAGGVGVSSWGNEKSGIVPAPYHQQQPAQGQYGNGGGGYPPAPGRVDPYNAHAPPMAMANHQSGGGGGGEEGGSKASEQGKKFGKKLGNAAIFGAGATIGGKIVNSIF